MSLVEIIKVNGDILSKKAPWLDGRAALGTLAEIESNFGMYNVPRYERAFDLSGKYGNRELWAKYGAMAACSWSSWQLMYPVAVELGCNLRPIDLQDDSVAIHWVMEYIQKRILDKGATTIVHFSDAYNSGSFKDINVPAEYVEKFLRNYPTIKEKRGLI